MKAIEKLVKDNLIRFIRVNKFNLKKLEQAEQALENEHIACNQVLLHLGYKNIEKRIVQYYTKQEIAVVGYSSFGHGDFPYSNSTKGKGLAKIANIHIPISICSLNCIS